MENINIVENKLIVPDKLSAYGTSIFASVGEMARKYDVINLTQGYPDYETDLRLLELLDYFTKKGFNQYAPVAGVPVLIDQISNLLELLYGVKVEKKSEIMVTAGATQAIFTVMSAFVEKGDEVIIIEPAYESYFPCVELNGGVIKSYVSYAPDFDIDWDSFKNLISKKTRLILINTPGNPSGRIFKNNDWEALTEIVKGTNILIMSDEVYEHSVFDNQKHHSILCFPELWKRTLAIFSLGKTFNTTGWRIGYIVAPEYLMKIYKKVHQNNVFAPHTSSQYAIAEYIKESKDFLQLSKLYEKKRDFLKSILKDSRFQLLNTEGGLFQLADYSQISSVDDLEFIKKLMSEYRVGAIPVSAFYSKKRNEKLIRFSFIKKESTLLQAGEILCKI